MAPGADNLSSNVGIQLGTTDRNNNGNSSANLRGLGANSTLVLLNGRRVSTHGAKGNAVDLSSIPLAAVQRVEVLKDGASADLRHRCDRRRDQLHPCASDYTGLEATAFADATEAWRRQHLPHLAARRHRATWPPIATNAMLSITHDQPEETRRLRRAQLLQRLPAGDRGLSPDTTGTSYATQTGAAGTAHRRHLHHAGHHRHADLQPRQPAELSGQVRLACRSMSQYQFGLWGNPRLRATAARSTMVAPRS